MRQPSDLAPPPRQAVLAIDVGGTKVLGALLGSAGVIGERVQLPTGGVAGAADPGLKTLERAASTLLAFAAEEGIEVAAIGAGFPEYVRDGELRSHEVLAWDAQPRDVLSAMAPGLPIAIESDVRCAALAESALGAGRGAGSFVYVSWGTGLSWTHVVAGAPIVGDRGMAIGLGELPVSPKVAPSWASNLEQFASGAGIAARYSATTGARVTQTREVVAAADSGDQDAKRVLTTAAYAVADALTWLTALTDPGLIVLGGGLGVADTPLRRLAIERYRATPSPVAPVPLVPSTLGTDTGLLGAAVATAALRLE